MAPLVSGWQLHRVYTRWMRARGYELHDRQSAARCVARARGSAAEHMCVRAGDTRPSHGPARRPRRGVHASAIDVGSGARGSRVGDRCGKLVGKILCGCRAKIAEVTWLLHGIAWHAPPHVARTTTSAPRSGVAFPFVIERLSNTPARPQEASPHTWEAV